MKLLFFKLIIILLLIPGYLLAQSASFADRDITGLWQGALYNDTTEKYLPYEIAISEEKGKLTGYSYTLFDIDGKKELGVKKIKLTLKGEQLVIDDVELIANNYSEPPPRKVRLQSIVSLLLKDTAMELSGKWSTNRTREYRPLTGSLQLVRKKEYLPLVLFQKLVELNLDKQLSFIKEKNKPVADIAIAEKPASEIKMPEPVAPQPVIEKKPDIDSVAALETVAVIENKLPDKVILASAQPIVITAVAKKVAVPVMTTKKDLQTAAHYRKKESIVLVADNPKPVAPAPVIKKTEPVIVVKEPVKKETKAPVETVKKTVPIEKPKVIPKPAPVVKTSPVAAVKEPIKTVAKMPAVVAAPTRQTQVSPAAANLLISGAAANVAERKINKEQFVFFESDSLVLTLYDNGDVDGDTVSVLMNGQIIFARQGLSTTPNSKTIYVDKTNMDSLSMIMYAENLGSIPPNTGLLIIMDGEKRYEVRFSADLKTNAAILLRRKIKEQ